MYLSVWHSIINYIVCCTTLLNVMNLFLNWSFIRCLFYVSKGFWKGECTDILYLLSYLFGTKFTGRKFYWWHRDNWPIGQWVIIYLHCSRHSLQCMSIIFFPAWVYNITQIYSGKINRETAGDVANFCLFSQATTQTGTNNLSMNFIIKIYAHF